MNIRAIASCEMNEILSSSVVDTFARLNITRKTQHGWQLLQSKFQNISSEGIEIEPPITTYGEEQKLRGEVGVSFRKGHYKMIFQTQYNANAFTLPTGMIGVHRRIYKRQTPRRSVVVRFWNASRDVRYGKLTNISGGGIGVTTSQAHSEGQYICEVDTKPNIVAESLLKHCEPDGNQYILNFQFLGIDLNPATQLKRIEEIQRDFIQYQSSETWSQETAVC